MIIKASKDANDKPYIGVWSDNDLVCVLDDWEDVDKIIHELLSEAAIAWPNNDKQ